MKSPQMNIVSEYNPPEVILDEDSGMEFIKLNRLGAGHFSAVYGVQCATTGIEYAAKFVCISHLSEAEQTLLTREVEFIARNIDENRRCPNIVDHFSVFSYVDQLVNTQVVCIVMEAGNENLRDYMLRLKQLTLEQVGTIFDQLANAIGWMQSLNTVHRDIKPENCVVFEQESGEILVKLCDFGFCKELDKNSRAVTNVGTTHYKDPHVKNGEYGPDCDVYSFGVMLAEALQRVYEHDEKFYELMDISRSMTKMDRQTRGTLEDYFVCRRGK